MIRNGSNSENWFEDDSTNDDAFLITEYDITSTPNDFNIKTIFDFIDSGVVHIPDFQRNYIWDIKRASRLIESLIIGIPIPQIFLYEESKNKFLVIDGQQRLMSIYYFIKKRFPKKEKRTEIRKIVDTTGALPQSVLENDNYFTRFNLVLPAPLPDKQNKLHGLNYSTLDEYKTTFDFRPIRNIVIKQNFPQNDDSSIYEIFNRLNTGGVNLKPQEIRTSLYHSDFYKMLYKINTEPKWRDLLGLEEPDLNKKDIEFLLRGFAMLETGDAYKPSMTKFLNNYSKHCKSLSNIQIAYLERLFISFLEACSALVEHPFHGKTTNKFNITVFESVFYAVCKNAYKMSSSVTGKISNEKLQNLKIDSEFIEATRFETARSKNVEKRISRAFDILK